jgi:hypothetical protein
MHLASAADDRIAALATLMVAVTAANIGHLTDVSACAFQHYFWWHSRSIRRACGCPEA